MIVPSRRKTTTTIDLLPDWLEHLYMVYGDPQVEPKPDTGVRFFDRDSGVWVTRRMWSWRVKGEYRRVYIDRCPDHYRTVVEIENGDHFGAKAEFASGQHPTEEQVALMLDLVKFP